MAVLTHIFFALLIFDVTLLLSFILFTSPRRRGQDLARIEQAISLLARATQALYQQQADILALMRRASVDPNAPPPPEESLN